MLLLLLSLSLSLSFLIVVIVIVIVVVVAAAAAVVVVVVVVVPSLSWRSLCSFFVPFFCSCCFLQPSDDNRLLLFEYNSLSRVQCRNVALST